MIAALADLFVERVEAPAPRQLLTAKRLLVVDATGRGERVGAVLRALEQIAPVSCCLVALGEVASLPQVARFEMVWLLSVDEAESDYAALIAGELSRRFAESRVEQIRAGAIVDGALEGGLPWRRRAAVEASARALAERLEA